MLIFKMEMRVNASKWDDEEQKKIFMQNAEDIVNQGLFEMTVPDWQVIILDVEEE